MQVFGMKRQLGTIREHLAGWRRGLGGRLRRDGDPGQGTTEYAILVGVLVVIAIIAIIALRPYIQTLWDSIVEGIGQLSS